MKIIGWLIVLALFIGSLVQVDSDLLFSFFDGPQLAWIVGFVLGGLLITFPSKLILDAFRSSFSSQPITETVELMKHLQVMNRAYHLSWSSGIIGYVLGVIVILKNLDDIAAVGPAIASMLLIVLYGAILAELFFASFQYAILGKAENVPPSDLPRVNNSGIGYATAILVMILLSLIICSTSLVEIPGELHLQDFDVPTLNESPE